MRFLACFVLLGACSSADPGFLVVALRTDYLPVAEVAEVDIAIFSVETSMGPSALRSIEFEDDLLMGIRVTSFDNLESGEYRARAILRDEAGNEVARREALLSFRNEATVVTIVITRDCAPVVCPGSGNPSFTECLGGRCVPPDCTPETPERCGVLCANDSACSLESMCAVSRCVEGTCFAAPTEGSCADMEYCDAVLGCIPGVCRDGMEGTVCRPATRDCDAAELCDADLQCPEDVDAPPGTACFDFNFCSEDGECGPCDEGGSCETGNPCEVGTTDCSSGEPVCVARFADAGTICRATASPCDEPEVCDGASPGCADDAPLTTTCQMEYRSAGIFAYEVPPGCTSIDARLWGAGGGSGGTVGLEAAGGFVGGVFDATPGETLTILVGAPGEIGADMGGGGGNPGGGDGADGAATNGGGGGGGFSAISTAAEIAMASAEVVAGGGGGGGISDIAGAGGGTEGQPSVAGGGTQSEGGEAHRMARSGESFAGGAGAARAGPGGGGGGGGYFGGGGGDEASGAGGSGYVSPRASGATLIRGNRANAGNGDAADRLGAGSPNAAGAVLLRCR